MTHYLHVKSLEPMVGTTDTPLYFFVRKLNEKISPDLHIINKHKAGGRTFGAQDNGDGLYVILNQRAMYRTLHGCNDRECFVLFDALAGKVQLCGGSWREHSITLLGKYRPLILYPNELMYWRELIRRVLTHPDKYPPLTNIDKLLFILTWHGAHLFWMNPRDHGASKAVEYSYRHTRAEPIPKMPVYVYPEMGVHYSLPHFKALWDVTRREAALPTS